MKTEGKIKKIKSTPVRENLKQIKPGKSKLVNEKQIKPGKSSILPKTKTK